MNEKEIDSFSEHVRACIECQTGVMRLQYLTYFTWLNEELITAPNFPAWVCDMCGRREYDSRAVNWLNTLLNPEARRRLTVRRKSDTAGTGTADL